MGGEISSFLFEPWLHSSRKVALGFSLFFALFFSFKFPFDFYVYLVVELLVLFSSVVGGYYHQLYMVDRFHCSFFVSVLFEFHSIFYALNCFRHNVGRCCVSNNCKRSGTRNGDTSCEKERDFIARFFPIPCLILLATYDYTS